MSLLVILFLVALLSSPEVSQVLRLIGKKGLDAQCKKFMKERNEQTTVLEALKLKSIGPWDASPEEDPDEIKAKIKETKELALETQKQYNEVVQVLMSSFALNWRRLVYSSP